MAEKEADEEKREKERNLQDFSSAPIGGKIWHIKENKISGD